MRDSPEGRFLQPSWASSQWEPEQVRWSGITMLVGGPVITVLGALLLAGVIQT
jgi:hypothetical protein